MFTQFLPWLIAGLATRVTVGFLLRRWRSVKLALPGGLAFILLCVAVFAAWQYAVDLPLGLIVGVLVPDLLRWRS